MNISFPHLKSIYLANFSAKNPSLYSNNSEMSPLIPRKVDFNQSLFGSKVKSDTLTFHTILDSNQHNLQNIYQIK